MLEKQKKPIEALDVKELQCFYGCHDMNNMTKSGKIFQKNSFVNPLFTS